MTLQESLTRYTLQGQRRFTRPHLGFTVKAAANDTRCRGCGQSLCHCPDPVWNGNVPPRGLA